MLAFRMACARWTIVTDNIPQGNYNPERARDGPTERDRVVTHTLSCTMYSVRPTQKGTIARSNVLLATVVAVSKCGWQVGKLRVGIILVRSYIRDGPIYVSPKNYR
jgi:hypothetical protein